MKRFYKTAAAEQTSIGWQVALDGRPIRTQGGAPQVVPTAALARLMAREWEEQEDTLNPSAFAARDMADYAIDVIAEDSEEVVEKLLGYAETDTLCYRADPEEPLWRRQQVEWEPLLAAFEAREGVDLTRVNGVVHQPQPPASLAKLRRRLEALGHFQLAALEQLTALSASLCIGLAALEPDADGKELWAIANLEEDWQAERWGEDEEALTRRAKREKAFLAAMEFARAAQAIHPER